MIRAFIIAALLPAAMLMGWLALGRSEPRADFVMAAEEPRTLDPHRASWLNELQITDALFEGLIRLNAVTLQPEPAAAESWVVDDDGLVYTFRLRESACWSNGDPLRAEDFRFAWRRALDPRVECQYASMLFVIAGAEKYYRSRTDADIANDAPADSIGIDVIGDRSLRVTLARPCPYFLDLLAFPTFFPVHPPTIEKYAYRDGVVLRQTRHLWTRPEHFVGNGPFVVADWRFKSRILLRRNERYRDAASVKLASIEVYITDDPNVALRAYESGRVDFLRDVSAATAQALQAEVRAGRRSDFHVGDRFATYFYRVNCRRPPLDQPAFRQAMSLAIDRDALCQKVTGMGETPALTYVPLGAIPLMERATSAGQSAAYTPPRGLDADWPLSRRIDQARMLLAQTGFDPKSREIELMFAPNPAYQRVAEALAAMWEKNLGLRVTLRTIEGKVLSERVRSLDYDLVRSDWSGDYMDPMTFLEMFTTGNGQNRTGWSNAAYDDAIREAAIKSDNARRFAYLREAERILCEEQLPVIPLYFRRGNFLLSPAFAGVNDNVREYFPLSAIHQSRPQ